MRRFLLVLAMLFSLWPIALVAAAATTAGNSRSGTENVEVTPPATPSAPAEKTQTVKLKLSGRTYTCPIGINDKLNPYRQAAGELQLQLTSLRASLQVKEARLRALDKQYPGKEAPSSVADAYNALARSVRAEIAREARFVHAFNREVEAHNHLIESECN
jgi:hypothetical protein